MGNHFIVTKTEDKKENLCDSCQFYYPDCAADEGIIEFGVGKGNDNIIACDAYKHK